MNPQNTQKILATIMLAVLGVGIATAITAFGLLSNSRSIQSSGTVKAVNIGVYWDSGCTNATSTIGWGMLSPGESKNVTVYLRNEGNVALRSNLTVQNWVPTGSSSYIGLVWNRENQTVAAGSVVTAVLTLSVSPSITGITDFSFDIVITGIA
jgi:hypothetical protein